MTVHNVWDLPLWAWRQYVIEQDEAERQAKEARRGK